MNRESQVRISLREQTYTLCALATKKRPYQNRSNMQHLFHDRIPCIVFTHLYISNEMLDFSILPTRLLKILNESSASISISPGKCDKLWI